MSNSSVSAVVVTFNRKDLLIECLESLKNQSKPLEGIYVIDNASSDGTGELLLEKGYIKELPLLNHSGTWSECCNIKNSLNGGNIDFHYVRLSENTGGAGGFYDGVKRAYDDGYDWLWLMDDDAEPVEDALEKLADYFDEDDLSALAGVVKTNNEIIPWHRGIFKFNNFDIYLVKSLDPELIKNFKILNIDHASFVGILVNRKSIAKIGFPKKEFFIYADDTEYSLRLRSVGRILLITDSIIQHKDYNSSLKFIKKKFLGHTFHRIKYENLWLQYYEKRNNIWLLRKYKGRIISIWILTILSWLVWIFGIILFDDNKFKRIHFITSAHIDGLKGNFDNKKPKEILYS